MKTTNPFKARPAAAMILLLCAFGLVAVLPACEDEDNKPEEKVEVNGTATLNADQEVGDVTSSGTGTFQGVYNKTTGEFEFTLSWSNLTGPPTMMHFHGPAGPGTNAGVKIGITGFPANATGSVSGKVTVEAGDRSDLLAGNWYVNIHTDAYPPGEIRGQVTFPSGSGGNGGDGGGGGGGY
ncbi:MAG: CHRD domain-containing protein [Solitalea sp.]